jgi:hypothetical protein
VATVSPRFLGTLASECPSCSATLATWFIGPLITGVLSEELVERRDLDPETGLKRFGVSRGRGVRAHSLRRAAFTVRMRGGRVTRSTVELAEVEQLVYCPGCNRRIVVVQPASEEIDLLLR